ncbi:hypothetical protein JG688_00012727 [Phytophthora aleatoria]|uniref:Uncharacterized protein n=1 Tax=Phytophthora aleatoria TaxID=2496075 RepID=A0A8J5IAT0_9STRA|nr:hypothetical protein JG688_00012727 [Phytophthora aleatoria]
MTLVYLVDTRYRRNLRVSNSSLATNARRRMEEFMRLEHARLVRIMHCLTAPSLLNLMSPPGHTFGSSAPIRTC